MPELPIEPIHQGPTNGCGTASLAMALNYLATVRLDSTLSPITQTELDRSIRGLDSFSAPSLLANAARKKGFYSALYNHATFEEITAHLDQNHPIIALINVDGSLQGLHYVVIHGYQTHVNPIQREIIITDPAPLPGKQRYILNFSGFCQKYWEDFSPFGICSRMNRLMLVLSNQDDLPPSRQVPLMISITGGVSKIINAIAHLRPENWFRSR